jgi:c-di-GMP-binding flagellar brake protein YcgR
MENPMSFPRTNRATLAASFSGLREEEIGKKHNMLLESLKTLILAGNQALLATGGLQVYSESVRQVRHGSLTFPAIGMVKITRGALQKIHIGGDSDLCSLLVNMEKPGTIDNGIDVLLQVFLEKLLEGMDNRNPQGQVGLLDIGPITLYTRGVRSFGFRLETDMGQLFLLAEIPSRLEYEQARGSEFLSTMVSTYLPRDWTSRELIDSPNMIENFLVFLRKAEGDVELEFPIGDGEFSINSGLLLETCRVNGQRALKMSVDLSNPEDPSPQPGDKVVGRFGVQDRAIRFELPYLGKSSYAVSGEASLDCVLFGLPEELIIDQRRRAFRIAVASRIPVEIEDLGQRSDPFSPMFGMEAQPLITGHLVDMSFSGARIISENDAITPELVEGSRVMCRLFLPDRPHGHEIQGVIRRSTATMVGRDEIRGDLGIEFLITPEMDRTSLEVIRQFVLTEQRTWLARRIHVPGGK